MSNINWDMLITKEMKDAEKAKATEAVYAVNQEAWRSTEMSFIADQLIALEDGAEDSLPGSDAEWRAYRTKVRNWREGADGYPFEENAPQRP